MAPIDELIRVAERAADGTADAAHDALTALPWLGASIDDDRAADRFSRWGASTVIDEKTGGEIIPRAVFDALHKRAGLSASWPVGNAGLLHGYGYLLSTMPTPYGLKRDRWLGDALAVSLGLPADHFLPWSGSTTLLARAEAAAASVRDAAEFAWFAPVDGRATHTALGAERGGFRALVHAVAPTPGASPLLVTTFPVADVSALRRELDEASARLRWNAA
ncbi:amino acid deaminase [Microbacterium resistens]|uniref:amino acid deaminase n=1 Tax=Microbacterium resistens TaxID=156977 RepID=UPI000AE98375|nr:amino acid deaminase [Microbacterium resistens]